MSQKALVAQQGPEHMTWTGSSAEVTFIPVLHEKGQPGATSLI